MLHQAQQCGLRRHQRPARLLLRQPFQAAIEFTPVLVEKRLGLATGWLINDILSGNQSGRLLICGVSVLASSW